MIRIYNVMISSCVLLAKIAVKFLMGRGIVVRLHTLHAVKMKVEKIVVLLHTLFAVQMEYTAVQKITIALMGGGGDGVLQVICKSKG